MSYFVEGQENKPLQAEFQHDLQAEIQHDLQAVPEVEGKSNALALIS